MSNIKRTNVKPAFLHLAKNKAMQNTNRGSKTMPVKSHEPPIEFRKYNVIAESSMIPPIDSFMR